MELEERTCSACKTSKFKVFPKSKQETCSLDCFIKKFGRDPRYYARRKGKQMDADQKIIDDFEEIDDDLKCENILPV